MRLTSFPPSCAVVMKSGDLNFLEPSGPLEACNGTALPLLILTAFLQFAYSNVSYHRLKLFSKACCFFFNMQFSSWL